ncbi:regulatory protein RecX [bacterium]|nr:regulatory protein RecX [bacterium]
MSIITDLKPQRRAGFINVLVDGDFVCGLSDYHVALYGLHVGDEVTTEQIEEFKDRSIESKMYAAALRYISYRIRSVGEVRTYLLRKEYDSYLVEALLQRLQRDKCLDDEDFVERWVRMRLEQNRSLATIRAELIKKQIDRHTIDRYLNQIDNRIVYTQIKQLVQKKRSHYTTLEKLIQYLLRKGFRYSDIQKAISDIE